MTDSAHFLGRPVRHTLPTAILSVSHLTEHPDTVDYSPIMRQMVFYVHDGCLSRQPVLLLVKEIQQDSPSWHITIHPLLEHEAKTLGFHLLPAIVMNDTILATGIPQKDWLLERMKECEKADRMDET